MEEKLSEGNVSRNEYRPPVVLLNQKQASLLLGVTTSTLESWRCKGCGPTYRKIGSLVRYLESDLITYIEGQSRHSTCESGQ
ncbi:MAG: helix-turn-helix domain-containing protein [Thermodesulfobacteriota bacterium]